MMQFLTTLSYLATMALGVVIGGFAVYRFNPKDLTINGKNKVKNGGEINSKFNIKKDGVFKRIFRRRRGVANDN